MNIDKKLIIEIATVLILLSLGAWLYLGRVFDKPPTTTSYENPGTCLILPQQYCDKGLRISYLGHDAIGFDLPGDTPVYMPFDGAYFDETPDGKDFSRMRLGINDTSSFVAIVGRHAPFSDSNVVLKKGDPLAIVVVTPEDEPVDFSTNSNVIMYAEDYDISSLFQ